MRQTKAGTAIAIDGTEANSPLRLENPEAVFPSPASAAPRADGLRVPHTTLNGIQMSGLKTNRIDRFRLLPLCLLFGSLSGLLVEIATHISLLGRQRYPRQLGPN